MRISTVVRGLLLAVIGFACISTAANASDIEQQYVVVWSGSSFGNSANATGTMTLDLTTLPNPESTYTDIFSDIVSLSITVTGAGAGNGTFTLANLAPDSDESTYTYWFTNSDTINMEGNVLSQLETDSGDFNLFFASPGPQGSMPLTLDTDALEGFNMAMIEFSPAPEPGTGTLMLSALGFLGLTAAMRKRISVRDKRAE